MKQIKGIDAKGYALYELGERDLNYLEGHDYRVGNVLIFDTSTKAKLGHEIGRANNLKAAQEFLTSLAERGIEDLVCKNQELQVSLAEKSKRINELSFLTLQNDIQREELINDLREISNTDPVKALAELDSLKVRILELETQLTAEKDARDSFESETLLLSAEKSLLEQELIETQTLLRAPQKADSFKPASNDDKELVLTNSSGGVIRIYHEFSPLPKSSIRKKLFSQSRRVIFVLVGIVVLTYIFYLTSVLETMRASGVDVQLYSDAVLERIRSLFGF
ncbi:MAG: hypothetical protein FWF91_06325 [Coriobacteriia bacterium]|nr:hypothetical protein [Coriobacteriia bacterium]